MHKEDYGDEDFRKLPFMYQIYFCIIVFLLKRMSPKLIDSGWGIIFMLRKLSDEYMEEIKKEKNKSKFRLIEGKDEGSKEE